MASNGAAPLPPNILAMLGGGGGSPGRPPNHSSSAANSPARPGGGRAAHLGAALSGRAGAGGGGLPLDGLLGGGGGDYDDREAAGRQSMDSNPDQAVLSELASSALSELLQQQGAGDDPLNLPPLPGETGGPDDQLTGGDGAHVTFSGPA